MEIFFLSFGNLPKLKTPRLKLQNEPFSWSIPHGSHRGEDRVQTTAITRLRSLLPSQTAGTHKANTNVGWNWAANNSSTFILLESWTGSFWIGSWVFVSILAFVSTIVYKFNEFEITSDRNLNILNLVRNLMILSCFILICELNRDHLYLYYCF